MRHHLFTPDTQESYKVAILIKGSTFNRMDLQANYLDHLKTYGVKDEDVIAFSLQYGAGGKVSVADAKAYLAQLMPVLDEFKLEYLFVPDAAYFKVLTGQTKADPHHGYVLPCKLKGYEHMKVVLGINYSQLIYNPGLEERLKLGLDTLGTTIQGTYQALGAHIIHSALYPETFDEIKAALVMLMDKEELAIDIEGFSLKFNEAGIGTISFAWDEHNGVSFPVEYAPIWFPNGAYDPLCNLDIAGFEGFRKDNPRVCALLVWFFENYKGKKIFHNAPYDVEAMIFRLWMKHLRDTRGLLRGLHIMCKNMHDTKVIAYLATNSTAGNVLGLKPLAHEFAGNWAVESINDIRRIPKKKLLQYNLGDSLSTFYVYKKYYPIMVQDQQEDLYYSLMLPSLKLIIQLELTGMPMRKDKIAEARRKLEEIEQQHLDVLTNSPTICTLNLLLGDMQWEKDFHSRQSKAKNPDKIQAKDKSVFSGVAFNPNSGPQTQKLVYEMMGLPVLDYTTKGQPATGADALEKLINHTAIPEYKQILSALIGYGKVNKILTSFIPAFEAGIDMGDGTVWLHGSFNLGGTVSGRLSSSDPNLQNIPAGSTYAKIIKECFMAPSGWLFGGADFNSLEDYISALTTKDPNKLAVYEQGFDGHCLRAAYYFRDQLPHIDLTDPKSVNSIKVTHPELRQESKTPTFALTYQGTYITLMANLGWSEDRARAVELAYHDLYKVSDQYIQDKLTQASKDGYVTVAFGLRVRTPLIKQVMWGSSKIPKEAAGEGRTAGNACGQSYGLLNNRAAVEFFEKVWASPYSEDILPVALIHDAIYILMKDDLNVVEWANRELIKSMQWQELPEIQHDTVKIGAALDIFYPTWANPITLPIGADKALIQATCDEEMLKRAQKASKS